MEAFKDNEVGYLDWHSQNPASFVLNRFGGTNPNFNVLHRSNCPFLWRNVDENSRTAVEKWCSDSENELAQHADDVLGNNMWRRCGVCFRADETIVHEQNATSVKPPAIYTSNASVWISGEPATFAGSGEKAWKQKATSELQNKFSNDCPQWLDIEIRILEENLYRKDLDNMVTPILDSARDAGWIERGFQQLGSVTARKVTVNSIAKVGALITPHINPPDFSHNRNGILIETSLHALDEKTVKWSLYEKAYELFLNKPELRFSPLTPLAMDIRVAISDKNRRKSIQALIKPCIDGVEPILGHPDNLLPTPKDQMNRQLAPQDEMVHSLDFHVRGGVNTGVTVLITPFNQL